MFDGSSNLKVVALVSEIMYGWAPEVYFQKESAKFAI
jgi:hypothetical protein